MNTVIVAHAGCGLKPNSISFLERAIHSEAHIVEIDVNYTKDEKIVLFHDTFVNQNGLSKPLNEITYDELLVIDKSILQIEEAFSLLKNSNKIINLDIKSTKCLPSLISYLKQNNLTERIIITGCDVDRVKLIKDIDTKIPVILSPSEHLYQGVSLQQMKSLCSYAIENNCSGLNLDFRYVTKEFVSYAKQRGLSVFVWTMYEKLDVLTMMEYGVTSITVNDFRLINELKGYIDEVQKWIQEKQKEEVSS